ncbi:hypothetical protein IWX49DRAFT_418092 [Phyllosticta citricarpa]|uniref:Secreted protein n=1 Tax=Phyllosticta citricarpa TaxID=55181 RepID=A0ABR1MDP1_9PEZI
MMFGPMVVVTINIRQTTALSALSSLFFLSHATLFCLVQKRKSANCPNKCSARRTCRCRWQACHVVSCHSFHAAPTSSSCLDPKQRGLHQRSSYFCDCCGCRCHEWR